MINYYQPFLLPFLHSKKYVLPSGLRQLYYHSWEDALWDLLRQKNIPQGSTILIPDFYCIDVVQNIQNHGYITKFYSLDEHFQIDIETFSNIVTEVKPSVIIVFHAAGITSSLMKDISWIHDSKNAIILEDCVHRLLDPTDIKLIHPNHIVMDSLRKDSPLPGSFVYGHQEFLSYTPNTTRNSRYFYTSLLYFLFFKIAFTSSVLLNIPSLAKFAHEKLLKKHDDIIGDSVQSHAGLPFVPFVHRHLNFQKVKNIKQIQSKLYSDSIDALLHKNLSIPIYKLNITPDNYKHLHVYPLGIRGNLPPTFISYLHSHGIVVWNKFPDSPWSKRQQVLFLPLGFHITENNIKHALNVIFKYSS